MDGVETLRHIREVSNIPVIVLTVLQSEKDKFHGLDLGDDDYIAKPFSPRELLSRTRALLRRSFMAAPARKTEIVVDPDLKIDLSRREVIVRGEKVVLRPTEYRLLYHLVSNAGRLLTHETLLSKVWGSEYRDEAHYLRLYITYLRQKIEQDPAHPKYILTERVDAALRGDPVDRVPASMWGHDFEREWDPHSLAEAMVENFSRYDWDYMK